MNWLYKTAVMESQVMGDLGEDGWELVSVKAETNTGFELFIFKREVDG